KIIKILYIFASSIKKKNLGLIRVVIKDSNRIVCEGIQSLISDVDDIEITDFYDTTEELTRRVRISMPNIILFNSYLSNDNDVAEIKKIANDFNKARLLIMSLNTRDSFILKSIKAGAKGFLTNDCTRMELIEAIYTLRGGYDYYGKSVTNILLNSYLKKSSESDSPLDMQLNVLSDRELEVLKLFSESYTNSEIAEKLFISIRTVESHKNNIMRKINLRTTVDLVKFAIRNNITEV
ncbi:MAG: response regulator transcription factor, partial [Bacteroidales bacterium]|nr:response regulator transcription factor [Bacteroidales bacterium]